MCLIYKILYRLFLVFNIVCDSLIVEFIEKLAFNLIISESTVSSYICLTIIYDIFSYFPLEGFISSL